MQRPIRHLAELVLVSERPTLGSLMTLCEENFLLFSRLAPHIKGQRGPCVSRRMGSVDLFLTIEEQARYTSVVRLTHFFPGSVQDWGWGVERSPGFTGDPMGCAADPDARLRIYHDARQVEVLDLRQTALPIYAQYQPPALDAKWKANLFLGKWLAFCLQQGHRFGPAWAEIPVPEGGDLTYTLT